LDFKKAPKPFIPCLLGTLKLSNGQRAAKLI
jgi:hypothetical protein